MAKLYMDGPYELTTESIDNTVTRTSPGNYALGRDTEKGLLVYYVGRSDDDVGGRLKGWVGEKPGRYAYFKYSYATSPKAAFEKECQNYHDFGGKEKLDNASHPQRSEGTDWECPTCDIFD